MNTIDAVYQECTAVDATVFLPVAQVRDRMATCYNTHHAMTVGLFPLEGIVSVGIRISRGDRFKTGNRCFYYHYKATFKTLSTSLLIWSFDWLIFYDSIMGTEIDISSNCSNLGLRSLTSTQVATSCNCEILLQSLVDVIELSWPKYPIYGYYHKEVNELDYRNLLATHTQLKVPAALVPPPMVSIDINIDIVIQ